MIVWIFKILMNISFLWSKDFSCMESYLSVFKVVYVSMQNYRFYYDILQHTCMYTLFLFLHLHKCLSENVSYKLIYLNTWFLISVLVRQHCKALPCWNEVKRCLTQGKLSVFQCLHRVSFLPNLFSFYLLLMISCKLLACQPPHFPRWWSWTNL